MSLDDVNQIVLTARISFAEWWRLGIVAVFGSQVRLRVITRFTATLWMHRGFETQAILRLVDIEGTALIQVMLALSGTQTDPPFVARGIYRFSSRPRQRRARLPRDLRIVGKRDDQRAASPQRVFIDEQLIARDSISDTLFKRLACQNACRGATHAKNRRADQTKCEYGSNARDQKACRSRTRLQSSGCAQRPANRSAERRSHPGLLCFRCGNLCFEFGLGGVRSEHGNAIV